MRKNNALAYIFSAYGDVQVLKAYDAPKGNKVVIMKTFDEKKAVMDVKSSTTAVSACVSPPVKR